MGDPTAPKSALESARANISSAQALMRTSQAVIGGSDLPRRLPELVRAGSADRIAPPASHLIADVVIGPLDLVGSPRLRIRRRPQELVSHEQPSNHAP